MVALAKYYQLPSAYAGSNLNEALADSVCHYINGDHAPPPLVLDFIRKYILSEPNTPTDNAAKLKSAKDLTSTHQCTEAIVLLNEIIKSEPQYIAAYYFRADAYERLAKHEESLHDLDHCLALLKILDLPAGDGYYFNCFCARVEVLTCLGRRKEALEALASAQAPLSNPINATARKRILSGRTPFGTEKSATGKHSN